MTRTPPRHRAPAQRVELAHIDGLDGLRGLAVAGVVVYHGGFGWASGGFLGVELFFVLSGFLITSLLIREWLDAGTVTLSGFWARRARRLLPALFVLVVVIGIYYASRGTLGSVPGLFGDGVSALFYYSNWHQVAAGAGYFIQTGPTSPFQHTWSLAIEEQFYVLWPLLLLGVAGRIGGSARGRPTPAAAARFLGGMLGLCLLLLIASTIDTLVLFDRGRRLDRVYYGTDTRATGLLAGAALAFGMSRWRQWTAARPNPARRVPARRTAALSLGSLGLLVGALALMGGVQGEDHWLYPWGFLLLDALAAGLIFVVVSTPRAIASRVFSLRPLRYLGNISYGVYLWHFPLFLWLDGPGTGLSGAALFAVRMLAAIAVSVLSYHLVEQPIRQRRWPIWIVRGRAPVTAGAGVISLALAASAAAVPTGPSAPAPAIPAALAGHDASCAVRLTNAPAYGTVAPPKSEEASFQVRSLIRGTVAWPNTITTKTFRRCPPDRALVIGDSIAFTIGVPPLYDEDRAGMALANAAILGCAFGLRGDVDVNGTWQAPPRACPGALAGWAAQARAFGAREIIFELGYRDEFDWRWNGQVVGLGDPAFDAYVESRIRRYISVLGDGGRRKLLFLTIPFVSPPAQADGNPAPQASTARHERINTLIRQAAAAAGAQASVLDIDRTISPAGHYQTTLNGQLCRFDGIHVTIYCGEVLEPRIFTAARALLRR